MMHSLCLQDLFVLLKANPLLSRLSVKGNPLCALPKYAEEVGAFVSHSFAGYGYPRQDVACDRLGRDRLGRWPHYLPPLFHVPRSLSAPTHCSSSMGQRCSQ